MTAKTRISRRTFWAQLQVSSFIRLGDIEGQSQRLEICFFCNNLCFHELLQKNPLYGTYVHIF